MPEYFSFIPSPQHNSKTVFSSFPSLYKLKFLIEKPSVLFSMNEIITLGSDVGLGCFEWLKRFSVLVLIYLFPEGFLYLFGQTRQKQQQ